MNEHRGDTAAAMNAHLWSNEMQCFSTSLPDGGHNPNKVVTGFWPLWTGLVPSERIAACARHLLDPRSFWRHHPVPSLTADSPAYRAGGDYWRGSVWAPTNAATAWGFARAGRHDLARRLVHRHLTVMLETYAVEPALWENYCPENSGPGSISNPDYSWTTLGPIALLYEVLIGIQPMPCAIAFVGFFRTGGVGAWSASPWARRLWTCAWRSSLAGSSPAATSLSPWN